MQPMLPGTALTARTRTIRPAGTSSGFWWCYKWLRMNLLLNFAMGDLHAAACFIILTARVTVTRVFSSCFAKDPVVSRIEERIAAWTLLPRGEISSMQFHTQIIL